MNKCEFPVGEPCWEKDSDKIEEFRNKLNYADSNIPLSIVECDIDIKNTEEHRIFAVLANRFEGDTLCYSFENNQHLIKTSVILQDAVKYNHAVITKIYNLLIWDKTYPLFRDTIQLLFDARVKAKDMLTYILAEIIKLIMNGSYGKFSQKYTMRMR